MSVKMRDVGSTRISASCRSGRKQQQQSSKNRFPDFWKCRFYLKAAAQGGCDCWISTSSSRRRSFIGPDKTKDIRRLDGRRGRDVDGGSGATR